MGIIPKDLGNYAPTDSYLCASCYNIISATQPSKIPTKGLGLGRSKMMLLLAALAAKHFRVPHLNDLQFFKVVLTEKD